VFFGFFLSSERGKMEEKPGSLSRSSENCDAALSIETRKNPFPPMNYYSPSAIRSMSAKSSVVMLVRAIVLLMGFETVFCLFCFFSRRHRRSSRSFLVVRVLAKCRMRSLNRALRAPALKPAIGLPDCSLDGFLSL
jgi:hypothetical protein